MPEPTKSQWRMTAEGLALSVPFVALVGAYLFVDHLRLGLADNYDHYREFWGGNPSEVFSHWLDMVLMSGGAAIIAWFLGVEVFLRRSNQPFMCRLCYGGMVLLLVCNGVIAIVLDGMHGEGTVIIVYPFFFIPILASSSYMLRRSSALLRWRPSGVIALGLSSVVLHTVAQLYYEPSGTGGSNMSIIPFWLACVGAAPVWAFARSIRSGLFGRTCRWSYSVGRKPLVWGSTILILLAITLYAHQVRKPREAMAVNWLNELETRLTDAFVEEIKRDHTSHKVEG